MDAEQQKTNWNNLAGSLFGQGIGTLFSGFGNEIAGNSIAQQQAWQERMMARQQAYWKEQFNMINEYNKPANVAKRYLEGGISPSAAFGGSAVGQSSTSAQLGSSGSPVGFPPTMQSPSQWFSTITQAISQLSSAYKNTAEGKSIMTMLEDSLEGLRLDNSIKSFAFELDKLNLPKKQKAEISKLLAEANHSQSMVNVANEDELLKMEERYKVIQERINEITKGKILSQESLHWLDTWKASMDEARSRIASNYGSANQSNTGARLNTANASREEFFNGLRNKPQARKALLQQIVSQAELSLQQGKLTKYQADQMKHLASQAAWADSIKEFDYFMELLRKQGDTSAKIIDAIVPF